MDIRDIVIGDVYNYISQSSLSSIGRVIAIFSDGQLYVEDILNPSNEFEVINVSDICEIPLTREDLFRLGYNYDSQTDSYIKILTNCNYQIVLPLNSNIYVVDKLNPHNKVDLDIQLSTTSYSMICRAIYSKLQIEL